MLGLRLWPKFLPERAEWIICFGLITSIYGSLWLFCRYRMGTDEYVNTHPPGHTPTHTPYTHTYNVIPLTLPTHPNPIYTQIMNKKDNFFNSQFIVLFHHEREKFSANRLALIAAILSKSLSSHCCVDQIVSVPVVFGDYYNLSADTTCTWPAAVRGEEKWLWRFPDGVII